MARRAGHPLCRVHNWSESTPTSRCNLMFFKQVLPVAGVTVRSFAGLHYRVTLQRHRTTLERGAATRGAVTQRPRTPLLAHVEAAPLSSPYLRSHTASEGDPPQRGAAPESSSSRPTPGPCPPPLHHTPPRTPPHQRCRHSRARTSAVLVLHPSRPACWHRLTGLQLMIDSMIEPQPGEGSGINTINQEGPGLWKKEPDAGTALPGRDPDFKCLEKDQVRTRTTEVLERECALDSKVWSAKGSSRYGASRDGW